MTRAVERALFVSQGPIGGGAMMGHVATEQALQLGMSAIPSVDARFVRLPEWSRLQRLAGARVPGLWHSNADLQVSRWHLVEARRARRVVAEEVARRPPDVIHVNSHVAALTLGSAPAGRPVFVAVDVTVADHDSFGGKGWLAPSLALERRSFARAAGVLAYSTWAAEAVARVCPGANVHVLHPGIDLLRFRPGDREHPGPLRVLFVGAGFLPKGGGDLLEAIGPLLGPEVELDVVTRDTPALPDGARLHRLEPGDPALIALFQQADVFCLPSLRDANPWVVVEAMACGLPVVASTVGSLGGLLRDSRTGIGVRAHDPAGLSDALRQLLQDHDLRAAFADRARAYAEEHFDARRQAVRLMDVMGSALSSSPATA